jgi:hypothetical protein
MQSNTKRNEHPACTCRMCSRGKRSTSGKHLLNQINRKIRRAYKRIHMDTEITIVSTPYTD